jgi:DNA-binding transcriptional regulator YdaS (Cro superfamily)
MNAPNIQGIIQRFGGQVAVAQALGMSQSAVSDWVAACSVPSQHIPRFIEAARALRPPLVLEPNDFFDIPKPPVVAETGEPATV